MEQCAQGRGIKGELRNTKQDNGHRQSDARQLTCCIDVYTNGICHVRTDQRTGRRSLPAPTGGRPASPDQGGLAAPPPLRKMVAGARNPLRRGALPTLRGKSRHRAAGDLRSRHRWLRRAAARPRHVRQSAQARKRRDRFIQPFSGRGPPAGSGRTGVVLPPDPCGKGWQR
jgi:hypothetical protein